MHRRFVLLGALALPAAAALSSRAVAQSGTPVVSQADFVLGRPDAPVTIVEYASLTCPHCATFHRETFPRIKSEWIEPGKARFVYRNFPFDRPGLDAAKIAECGGKERYYAFLDTFFASQDRWARDPDPLAALKRLAKLGGLGEAEIEACLRDDNLNKKIVGIRLDAEKNLRVESTPTFFINGKKLVGAQPYARFEEMLKAASP